jgi:hypothetical protein
MLAAPSYQRPYDTLTIREGVCGQFAQARQSEALQERLRRRKTQPTVGASEFLHKFEIPKFHNEPSLVASKSRSISAWLIGCLKAMQASTSSAVDVR